MKGKILVVILSLILITSGFILFHVLQNNRYYDTFYFFDIGISRFLVFDLAMFLMGCGVFIEFYMMFKPIEFIKEVKNK